MKKTLACTETVKYALPGLEISSLEDATRATGATLFYFPNGAMAQADIRGGSAATSEVSLLESGSMSCWIDGIVFAGGSTMGLAASDGVRNYLYESRGDERTSFNKIPSVPGAVVYDFGGRIGKGQDRFVYPDEKMGRKLMTNLSKNSFLAGRAGAGVCTTANKISKKIWGGQGLAYSDLGFGKVVAAVINNPAGNLSLKGIKPVSGFQKTAIRPKTNTTLSIIITDLKLDRDQLKRLATSVHTSMARQIFPFQTFSDGDSHFAVSLCTKVPKETKNSDYFMDLTIAGCEAMDKAIETAALIANREN
jgi:L-aminopeptidase/D-esterase-like protein